MKPITCAILSLLATPVMVLVYVVAAVLALALWPIIPMVVYSYALFVQKDPVKDIEDEVFSARDGSENVDLQ